MLVEERTFRDLGKTDAWNPPLFIQDRECISSSKFLTGLWSIRDDRCDARSHLSRYNYENPIESGDLLKELNQVIQKGSFPHGRKFMLGTWHRSCRWGRGTLQGANGKPMVICDGLLFLFKHLSFLKQPLHNPSTAVNHPQRCAWGCVVLFLRMSYGEMGPSITIFRIIRRSRWVPSKINLITLLYALRPIAKLCLLHGPARPDRIYSLYSQCVHFFGRVRGCG